MLTVIPTEHGCSTCYPERGCVAQPLPTHGLAPWHRPGRASSPLSCGAGGDGRAQGQVV